MYNEFRTFKNNFIFEFHEKGVFKINTLKKTGKDFFHKLDKLVAGYSDEEKNLILDYVMVMVSFRIEILSEKSDYKKWGEKANKREEKIAVFLSKEKRKKITQLVVYKDKEKEEIRKERDLKNLKEELLSTRR